MDAELARDASPMVKDSLCLGLGALVHSHILVQTITIALLPVTYSAPRATLVLSHSPSRGRAIVTLDPAATGEGNMTLKPAGT